MKLQERNEAWSRKVDIKKLSETAGKLAKRLNEGDDW